MRKIKVHGREIVGILKEVEAGITVSGICRKHGVSDATYYNWETDYGGMTASDIKKLRQLKDEELSSVCGYTKTGKIRTNQQLANGFLPLVIASGI